MAKFIKKIGFTLVSLLLISCSIPIISEQDEMLVWEGVKCECPECRNVEKPLLLFSKEPLYQNINSKKVEVMGSYIPFYHTIILREWADIRDYEHECRHACGDDKWDEYYHSWSKNESEPVPLLKNLTVFRTR